MTQTQTNLLPVVITILIVLPLLYFRLRKGMKVRPLKLKTLWVRPAIVIAAAALLLSTAPLPPQGWVWLTLAVSVGGGIGWYWGKTMALHIDPEHGTLMVKGSQAAVAILVLLIVLRLGLRTGLQMEVSTLNLSPQFIADIFIVFTAGLFSVQTLEMFLRARRVLTANNLLMNGNVKDGG